MKIEANSVDEYIAKAPEERRDTLLRLRHVLLDHLPKGFVEELSYGMPGYVVPHTLYSPGYHCDPRLPLPFVSFASQKNFIALYHMGLYASPGDTEWFTSNWDASTYGKLDMGKSCIRFKKMDRIPWELIAELATRMTPQDWIARYESAFQKK